MGRVVLNKSGRFLGYMVVGLSQQECVGMLTGINRQYAITDDMGWIYMSSNQELLSDDLGRFVQLREKKEGTFTLHKVICQMGKSMFIP